MAGAEMFTVMAVLDARDRISEALEKAQARIDQFTGTLQRMAGVAEESGARTDEALLQTASNTDAVVLADARAKAAAAEVAAARREQAAAELDLLDVQRQMAAGEMDAAEAADKQAAALARLKAAERDTAAASKEAATAQKLQADTAEASAAKTDAAAGSQGLFSGAMSKSGTIMGGASKFALGAGVAVAAIGYESVKAATSFQTLTTQLVTTAGEAPSALKQVQAGILTISTQTATSANDLAKSMYIVEAAGYNAAHGGLDVLKAATEGARLENSDFKTVANGVTDILKDYHQPASQAANVTSQLVSAVGHGKANFQQFSSALSNILPLGAAVHLKFNDLAGVLAEMTSHGVTAQRASQNMANALRSLEAPTGTMTKEFKEVGISAQDVQQHLNTQGLGGTLQWLSGIAKENAGRLGQTYPGALKSLMGTAAGLNTALMTTGENAGETNKAIKDIGKASADSKGNVQGFSKVQETLGFKMGQAKNAIHNTGVAIGTALIPFVTKAMGAINKIIVPIAQWVEKHQRLVAMILGGIGAFAALVGVLKIFEVVMAAVNLVMDANPISLIIIAVVALVAAFIYCWNHFKGFRDFFKAAWKDIQHAAEAAWHFLESAFNAISKAVSTVVSWIGSHWQLLLAILTGPIGIAVYLIKTYWSDIVGFFEAAWNAIKDGLSTAWNSIVSTTESVWNGISSFFSGLWNDITSLFKMVLDGWKNILTGAWDAIKTATQTVWNWIKDFIQLQVRSVETVLSWFNKLGSMFAGWLHSAENAVSNGVGRVVGFFERLPGTILRLLSGAGSWLVNTGVNIVIGLWNGIVSMGSWLWGQIEGWIKSVVPGPILKVLGIGSPSKWAHWAGQMVGEGLSNGVLGSRDKVSDSASKLAGAVKVAAAGTLQAGLTVTGTPNLVAAGTPGLIGAGAAAGGGVNINLDLRGAHIMSDADIRKLADQVGRQMPHALAAAGVRIRA